MKTITLLAGLLAATTLGAQVGVNNPNPTQALDVAGKIKLADDGTAPSAGTMRYEAGEAEFQGYDGRAWTAFNAAQAGGALPSAAVPVFGKYNALSPSEQGTVLFYNPVTASNFSAVPAGKTLIVTAAWVGPNFFNINSLRYNVGLYPSTSSNALTGSNPLLNFTLRGDVRENSVLESSLAPLTVVVGGSYLYCAASSQSEGSVEVYVRGFLVDDLTY